MDTYYPTVSVIVNTHKRSDMLARALDSVLTQVYKDFEVVVVHDGPPDEETLKMCGEGGEYWTKFVEAGHDFQWLSTDECSGYQCVPKNVALARARGDYIAFLDDDNEFLPHHLQVLMGAMLEGLVWPDFAYARWEYVKDEGYVNEELKEGPTPFQPWDEFALRRLASSPMANFIDTSSFIAAKGAYWRLYATTEQWWNESYRRFGDWELLTRAVYFADWRGKAVDEVTMRYHWHGKNVQLTRAANEQVVGKAVGGV